MTPFRSPRLDVRTPSTRQSVRVVDGGSHAESNPTPAWTHTPPSSPHHHQHHHHHHQQQQLQTPHKTPQKSAVTALPLVTPTRPSASSASGSASVRPRMRISLCDVHVDTIRRQRRVSAPAMDAPASARQDGVIKGIRLAVIAMNSAQAVEEEETSLSLRYDATTVGRACIGDARACMQEATVLDTFCNDWLADFDTASQAFASQGECGMMIDMEAGRESPGE
jgi:hypothetical protein